MPDGNISGVRTTLIDSAEVAARPAEWYASRPIPRRLVRDLLGARTKQGLTLVERAHRTQTRRLVKQVSR